jgi:hypothetical protein
MDNNWTLIIIGLYTLIYVIVFIIQKSQIERIKEINTSMKSFMDIFDIQKVRDFTELSREFSMMKASKMVLENEEIKKAIFDITDKKTEEIKSAHLKVFGDQYNELTIVVLEFLKLVKEEDREQFIKDHLKSCEHVFSPLLDKLKNNNI